MSQSFNYAIAFNYLVPGAKWSRAGDDDLYENYEWHDERPRPTKQQCDAIMQSALIEAHTVVARDERRIAYSAEADPLFFKAQRGEDGVTLADWEAKVAEIRERFPYPA